MRTIPGLVELELLEKALLFDVRQNQNTPTVEWFSVGAVNYGRGQCAVGILVAATCQGNLPEISVSPGGSIPHAVHSFKE